ncbi:MAG TPA: DUF2935 domain-containing protein [Luteimonas sp.]|nr:DUF2935 domain-containing protein [Luteimonas sp.]
MHTRSGGDSAESSYEKPMILPALDEQSPSLHAWADARFAVDIMAEHALFFVLLMPPELAAKERDEADRFHKTFTALYARIEAEGPPEPSALKSFAGRVLEEIKPFVEYKARLGDAQTAGSLRSLVWPLFFDHTRHEAERWTRRLETLALGESEFDKSEVSHFWTEIMDEHARFVAHLLDPDEFALIETCMKTSRVFCDLHKGGAHGVLSALVDEPGTVTKSLIQNPETNAILSAAQTILDFKTKTARDIEGGRIKSIIDPRLADHVRREALKFVDELKRAH